MKTTSLRILCAGAVSMFAAGAPVLAQEILLQEGFNTDGEASTPKRYTMVGRDVYEPQRIRDEIGNFDQKGPIYWEHNFKVSYVGNPDIPGRRAIFGWRGTDGTVATADLWTVFDATVDWLLAGKKNAQIVVNPNVASIQGLADHLTAAGHTLVDDDTTANPNEADVPGDLFIHGPGANNASRFILRQEPVLVMNAPDYDDMLVGSIGTSATFDPGQVTITAPGNPAAGGKTGSFDAFTTGGQIFELIGSFLPTNAITLATVTHVVPPAVNNLSDVDAMIAGTKAHDQTQGQVTELDFSDGSSGQWLSDNPIPGGYTGNWGLLIKGKLTVAAAGTYRFAVGSDDGARFQIDRDKNGFTAADNILEDPGPHAHQIVYANVDFSAAGTYDFQAISYNAGAGGSLELSVGNVPASEVADDNLDSGYWELLGTSGAAAAVTLSGQADVTAYVATGPNVERQEPVIVLLNGPNDTPRGAFFDGGPVSGFEGTGFLAGAGMNKWAYPDQGYRSVQLNPVNVAGKTNVQLTIALAATVVDFETDDHMDVVIYPNGVTSAPIILAHFHGVQNAVQPWMADEKQGYTRRLTRQFADFKYDIPSTATDLVIEVQVGTTWWTEIVAVDNIRLTAGAASAAGPVLGAATISGGDIKLTWTGGTAPFAVQWSPSLPATWVNLMTTSGSTASIPAVGPAGFFRIQSAAGNVPATKLFKASLAGPNEVPVVDSPATGAGAFILAGDTLTYYVSYSGLTGVATASHIHGPAPVTEGAGVMFPLAPLGAYGTSGVLSGTATLTADQKTALEGGLTYANIHTALHVGGEIRGQVIAVP